MVFEEGKTNKVDGNIKFGVNGNGFHFCKRLEDTLRYIDDKDPKIARVIGRGTIDEGFDDYNGYYDMYASSIIDIKYFLMREEIFLELVRNSHAILRAIV